MNNNIDPNDKQQSDYIWQDREIRFDSKVTLLACRKGEKIIGSTDVDYITYQKKSCVHIDSINSVEDTKGNNGERGYQYIMLYVYVIHVIYCILFCFCGL